MRTIAIRPLFFVLFLAAIASLCSAQGLQPFGSFGGGPFDTINLGNLDVHFAIPVVHKAGRGIPFNYDISYDSLIWGVATSGGVSTWQPGSGWGWQSQTDAATGYIPAPSSYQGTCRYFDGRYWHTETWTKYTYSGYVDQFGTFHHVRALILVTGAPDCIGDVGSITRTADDGSGYAVTVPDGTVTGRDGTIRIVPVATRTGGGSVTDANGNQIGTNGSTFTDTLGKAALSVTGNVPTISFTYTAPGTNGLGTPVAIKLNYTQKTVCTNFRAPNISEYPPTSVYLVTSISMPDTTSYSFAYEPTPSPPTGCTGAVTGRIASVTLPSGGSITYSYQGGANGYNGIFSDGTTSYISRTVNPVEGGASGTWTYSRSESLPASTTTVIDPLTNETDINFEVDGNAASYYYETQRKAYENGTATLLRTTITCYNGNNSTPANCPTAAVTSAPSGLTERTIFAYLPDTTGQESETDTKYNTSGLVTDEYDYDFGSGAVGALLRHTYVTYAALGNGIVDHPSEIIVYDGGSHSNSDTFFRYDEVGVTASGATQLVQITGSRGNLTTLQSWGTAWLYRTFTYYDTGNVITATDASTSSTTKGPATTSSYSSTGSCNYAFPTSVAEPLSLSRSMTWDCNGGVLTSVTDENSQKTSFIFNDPNYWRTTSVQFPDSTSDTATFTYNTGTSTPWSIVVGRAMDASRSVSNQSFLDGFGRVYKQQTASDPNGTATVDTVRDALGRVSSVSNPYYQTSDQTYGTTQYAYDALNRTTTVTNPDNSQKQLTYTKRAVQMVDEGNNAGGTTHITRVYQVDGLGRTASVCEVSNATLQGSGGTPAACGQDISVTGFLTSYQHDAIGNITSVSQPGVNSRSFVYDELSRLTQEINPESGATTYTYDTGTAGNLYQRTRPKPNQTGTATVVTTYTFDALHRPTGKSYNDGSTPAVTLSYDQTSVGGVSPAHPKGRLTDAVVAGNAAGTIFSYDPMGRIAQEWQCTPLNCGSSTFNLQYSYDFLGDVATFFNGKENVTYTYSYDTAARLTKLVSSFSDTNHPSTLLTVSSANYNPLGEVKQATLGNGVVRTLNYDNRGRITSLADGSLYSFTLGYANDSNILTGNDSINGSWTYTSDAMGRIATSSKTGQAFSYNYDPSGNRWKQNVTTGTGPNPQYTFDANNHITGNGVIYDAAGNVTNDGLGNTYTYDAEGRLLTVNGTGGVYTYDAFGKRVRTVANSQTNDFIFDMAGRALDSVSGTTWQRGEIFAGAWHLGTYNNTVNPASTYFEHDDWLGTARARSNVSGTRTETCSSLPYGDSQSCTGTDVSPLHFADMTWDSESYLQHAWFRQYSTTEGWWATPDPAGLAAVDATNPQTWNRYAYVGNNPIGFTDSLGLVWWLVCEAGEDGISCYWAGSSEGGTPPPTTSTGGGGSSTSKKPNFCNGANGKSKPVATDSGRINFQFDAQGQLVGLGVQLTGTNTVNAPGLYIAPNTFAGFTLTSPGTVQFGFNNPVNFGTGFSQAYFQTATFSGGKFSSVNGALAPFGLPIGSTTGSSAPLRWALNGQLPFTSGLGSEAQQFGNLLTDLATLLSQHVNCQDVAAFLGKH